MYVANNYNSMAQAINSSITRPDSQLTPLKTQNNEVPQGFPETLNQLNTYTGMENFLSFNTIDWDS